MSAILAVLLATTGTSSGAAESNPNEISVKPADTVVFRAISGKYFGTLETEYVATAVVLVSGGVTDQISFEIIYDNGATEKLESSNLGVSNGVARWKLTFDTSNQDPVSGFLVVSSTVVPTEPVVVPVRVTLLVPAAVFGLQAVGLLGLLVLFGVSLWCWRLKEDRDRRGSGQKLRFWEKLPGLTKSKWDFRDSWASNLLVAGSLTSTLLAASGALSDVLPGLSVSAFVWASLLYGFLGLAAPVVYKVLSRDGEGTVGGLTVSATLTVGAVGGLTATLTTLLHRGGVTRWLTLPLGGLILALAVAYAWSTLPSLVEAGLRPSPQEPVGSKNENRRSPIL